MVWTDVFGRSSCNPLRGARSHISNFGDVACEVNRSAIELSQILYVFLFWREVIRRVDEVRRVSKNKRGVRAYRYKIDRSYVFR